MTAAGLVLLLTLNMVQAGMVGDGVTDNSATFQALLNAHLADTEFYFPAGTYQFRDMRVTNGRHLTFRGVGASSILQYNHPPSTGTYTHMMRFTGSTGITFQDIAFDNRSIPHFGGIVFYASKQVVLRRVLATDSAPLAQAPSGDCYGFLFGRGAEPHDGILVEDSTFHLLPIEIDYARNVRVRRNLVYGARGVAGIGSYSLGNGGVYEHVVIEENTILDPQQTGQGIVVHLDPPWNSDGSFKDITIRHNYIRKQQRLGSTAIQVGTSNNSVPTTGNAFDDIRVLDNTVEVVGAAVGAANTAVFLLSRGDWFFKRAMVLGNTGRDFLLRYVEDGMIARNVGERLQLSTLKHTTITDNVMYPVGTQAAYQFDWSVGGNVMEDNTFVGAAAVPLRRQGPNGTDVVETPVQVTLP